VLERLKLLLSREQLVILAAAIAHANFT